MKRRLEALSVCVFWLALLPCQAEADIAPRDTSSCAEKKLHDTCTLDGQTTGTCEPSTCTRNDYSQGVPPKSVTVDCLTCVATQPAARPAAQAAAQPVAQAAAQPAAQPAKKSGCSSAPTAGILPGILGWLAVRRRTMSPHCTPRRSPRLAS